MWQRRGYGRNVVGGKFSLGWQHTYREVHTKVTDRTEIRTKGVLKILKSARLYRPVTTAIVTADVDHNGVPDIVFGDEGGYVDVIRR